VWELDWPAKSINNPSPFTQTKNSTSTVVVEIINSEGKSIGRQTVKSPYGFESRAAVITPLWQWEGDIVFTAVNANLITDKLTIKITSIDGIAAENASKQKNISVMPLTEWESLLKTLPSTRRNIELARQLQREQELAAQRQREAAAQRERELAAARTYPANMVRVEGGTFQMGTANAYNNDERPVHTVTVKTFYMGKYEVTQKEWQEVMGNNPSRFKGDNLPVEQVSWFDAIEYCNKRSQKEGLTPVYRGSGNNITCDWNANGYRLPTEAEWEFAAKGGIKDKLITEYSGSNNVDAVAWYIGNSGSRTYQVGTKAPNSLGLYDMSGNVYEWCWDWYGSYTSGAQTDPKGPISGADRVVRGGSWSNLASIVRSVKRVSSNPSDRNDVIGFRLVRP